MKKGIRPNMSLRDECIAGAGYRRKQQKEDYIALKKEAVSTQSQLKGSPKRVTRGCEKGQRKDNAEPNR